jgi:predicted phage tail protein
MSNRIFGAKGKGDTTSGGQEAANTLRSQAYAQFVDLLGEGEIVGLVLENGTPVDSTNFGQAILLNDTPVQDTTNNFNYLGVIFEQRTGLPDQAYLTGATFTETPISVDTKVSFGQPITRTITDPSVDSARVIAKIPALANLDSTTGSLTGASVSYIIEVRPSGGAFSTVVTADLVNQKCTSEYQRDHVFDLPPGGAPWDIRFTRLTADSTSAALSNETWFESYSEIIKGRFTYPDSALVQLWIDSSQFGSSIPTRGYRVRGLKTNVPTNYDPETRTYTGVWDGTFKKAWHSNPAWVFYDLLYNNRYGIGEFIPAEIIDKWGLYTIGRYCDELIPSGFKDPQGADIMEPRFTFNGVINSREEAYKVLGDIVNAFRGMAYWSLGQVFAAADMPRDPITTVSPANVIDGMFRYSGTAMKARHSAVLVSWNDPADHYKPAIELVQNDNMLRRFGWRQKDVAPVGCTSRGQAHRFGKWILDTEENETETVQFTMSWDGYVQEAGQTLKPGDIILVSDPRKTGGVRTGGRLRSCVGSTVTLDAPFDPLPASSYSLTAVLPTGGIETKPILTFSPDNQVVTISGTFSATPVAGAMFVIQGTDVNARRYSVLSVRETDKHLFEVTALFNDPNKYARVEQNVALDPIIYTRPPNTVPPPTNLDIVESNYFENGIPHSRVTLSWSAPAGTLVKEYALMGTGPNGPVDFGTTALTSVDLFNITPGEWTFSVMSVSFSGIRSTPASKTQNIGGWSSITGPTAISLQLIGGGTEFTGTAPTIIWDIIFPTGTVVYEADSVVRIYDPDTMALLRTETLPVNTKSYTYNFEDNLNDGGPRRSLRIHVSARSLVGVEQDAPAEIIITNPPPASITPDVKNEGVALRISWTVVDSDYYRSKLWVSQSSDFNPLAVAPVYDGPDTNYAQMVLAPGLYYIRVGAYDVFGTVGMIIGPQVAITASGMDIAIFNQQLSDLVTEEFQAATDAQNATAALIASVAAEQDAANWLDKKNVQTLVRTNVDVVNTTIADLGDNVTQAISAVQSEAQTYADNAVAVYNTAATALFATQTEVSLAISSTTQSAQTYADQAVALLGSTVNAVLSDKTKTPVTISIANPTVIGWPAHGFAVNQPVQFSTTGVLPSGILANVPYYVISAGLTADAFRISARLGGTAVNTTGSQSGVHTGRAAGLSSTAINNTAAIQTTTDSLVSTQQSLSANYMTAIQTANADSNVLTTANANANQAIVTLQNSIAATYATISGVATAKSEAITTAAANASSALASYDQSTTASFGGLRSAVSTNSTAVAGINNKLAAQYTVKLDVNGYVSSLTGFNDGAVSGWTFVGNTFQVAFPSSGPVIGAPVQVFQIANVSGVPRITMRGDMFADGTIEAKSMVAGTITAISGIIGDLAVGTLKIGDNAVTVTVVNIRGDGVGTGGIISEVSGNISGVAGKDLTLLASFTGSQSFSAGNTGWSAALYINGTAVASAGGLTVEACITLAGALTVPGSSISGGLQTFNAQLIWSPGLGVTMGSGRIITLTAAKR